MRFALATCLHPLEHDVDADFLVPALARGGAEAETPAWNDPGVDWTSFDLVMPNSTWDYHEHESEFRAWLRTVAESSRLRNPLDLIEWNLDKRYLRELEERGVLIIPTIWAEPASVAESAAEAEARGWEELIIKPVVDLGARNLVRVAPAAAADMLARFIGPTMIQPFLPTLATEGELSLVYLGGELSHTLRKLPARGDFRIQPEYGGVHEAAEASPAAREVAERAIAGAGAEDALYARVDLVTLPDGSPALIELELIEPALYLDVDPRSAERLARAMFAAAA
jgi:glutathione synthase/RimK-type ligase-like ATP-grasp enzyme